MPYVTTCSIEKYFEKVAVSYWSRRWLRYRKAGVLHSAVISLIVGWQAWFLYQMNRCFTLDKTITLQIQCFLLLYKSLVNEFQVTRKIFVCSYGHSLGHITEICPNPPPPPPQKKEQMRCCGILEHSLKSQAESPGSNLTITIHFCPSARQFIHIAALDQCVYKWGPGRMWQMIVFEFAALLSQAALLSKECSPGSGNCAL